MDLLDKIILDSARHVTITSYSLSAGNAANAIEIEFAVSQDKDILSKQPWIRLVQWMILKKQGVMIAE